MNKKKNLNSTEESIDGRWWKIKKKSKKIIRAKYNKITDWVMDPKGYFLIKIDKNSKLIRVGYCKISNNNMNQDHEMICEVIGKTAIEIVNTLIKEGFVSSLQHAADMGIELNKAEIAMKNDLEYVQDKDIVINKNL
tara:strand:+ start:1184 stop:1594 length:411 start_codon:yes stop_codon:yes gene_type:complete